MDYRYVCFTEGVVICCGLSVHRTSILVHDRLLNATPKCRSHECLEVRARTKFENGGDLLFTPIEPKFRLQLDIFGVDRKRTQTGHFLRRVCVYAALQDRSRLEDFPTVRCMGSFLVSLSWEISS